MIDVDSRESPVSVLTNEDSDWSDRPMSIDVIDVSLLIVFYRVLLSPQKKIKTKQKLVDSRSPTSPLLYFWVKRKGRVDFGSILGNGDVCLLSRKRRCCRMSSLFSIVLLVVENFRNEWGKVERDLTLRNSSSHMGGEDNTRNRSW